MQLNSAGSLCRQQRDFAARVGADAHRAQAQLQQAQQRGGQLAGESATLAQALEQEAAINKQNSTEIQHLEEQLQVATKQASEASKTLEKVCSPCDTLPSAEQSPRPACRPQSYPCTGHLWWIDKPCGALAAKAMARSERECR